jgi:hypothetical protein
LLVNRVLLISFLIENLTIFYLSNSLPVRVFLVIWLTTSLGIFKALQPKIIEFPFHATDIWGLKFQCEKIERDILTTEFKASMERSSSDPSVSHPTMLRTIHSNMRSELWEKRNNKEKEN